MQSLIDLYSTDPHKACRRALRMTTNTHWKNRPEAVNRLLGMHGEEAVRGEWENGYWCDIVAVYCNAGDTYDCTVIFPRDGRPVVTDLGTWIERNEKRLAIV